MIWVALLRGINVGGNRKVDMKRLKVAFEDAGMTEVRTYINSGNVIFSSRLRSRERLCEALEKAILEEFGFEVGVLLVSETELRSIVKAIPKKWVNDDVMRCDVLFLWKDVDREAVIEELAPKADVDEVRYTRGAVIWRIDRPNVTRSRLQKVVGTALYKRMTIRNCNTTRKLLELIVA